VTKPVLADLIHGAEPSFYQLDGHTHVYFGPLQHGREHLGLRCVTAQVRLSRLLELPRFLVVPRLLSRRAKTVPGNVS